MNRHKRLMPHILTLTDTCMAHKHRARMFFPSQTIHLLPQRQILSPLFHASQANPP